MKSRDIKIYRHKEKTCIKTIMGSVEFKREVYEYKDDNAKKQYIYLLD